MDFSPSYFCLRNFPFAAQGPRHKSLRAYAMGNAHVAIVDGKEAIYYNYAGLNQMGKLGHYDKYPETGYYPSNDFDFRINVGGAAPFNDTRDIYHLAEDIQDLYDEAEKAAKSSNDVTAERAFADSLANHPELTKKINQYDHLLFNILAKADIEFAMHNVGVAVWVDGNAAPILTAGSLSPILAWTLFMWTQLSRLAALMVLQTSSPWAVVLKLPNDNMSI